MAPDSAREPAPQRERVVLSERRGARMVRTRVQVAEQTGVGEHLVRGLVRAQLALALRLGVAVLAIFVAIPLIGATVEPFADATVFGLRLNWLILGLLPLPLLYLAGRLYIRLAEQAERDFVRLVDADSDSGDDPGGGTR
ncbi:membrane protein [Gordonia sp. QH-12]|nr:membrane protein [Gordonia sp. QH-12]